MYKNFLKRPFDIICILGFTVLFWWVYVLVAVLVKKKLGSPVIFKQERPGLNGRIFTMYKFRSMTDERDEEGKLLSDEIRLTKFGKFLRSTSLDELPEFLNVVKGDMSLIGPRPQLVRDMVFMSDEQKKRHDVRPGVTGLAQVNGRNAISWEDKFITDLEYIENLSFIGDIKIIFKTIEKIFVREGVSAEGMETAEDFGDYLLRTGKVSKEEYKEKQEEALKLLENSKKINGGGRGHTIIMQ